MSKGFSKYRQQPRAPRFERKATSPAEMKSAVERYGSVRKAAAKLGISKSTLHDYIKGKGEAKRKTLAKIDTGISSLPLKERKAIEKKTVEKLRDQGEFNKYIEAIRQTQGSVAVLRAIRKRERE